MCGAEEQAVHHFAKCACGESTIRSFTSAIVRPAAPNGGGGKAMCEAGSRRYAPFRDYDRHKVVPNGSSGLAGKWGF